ncbi:unnamed protein product [Rotaria sp. Silwood2]|nr:unnamed protein product [Rotaria sp. Silwood2]
MSGRTLATTSAPTPASGSAADMVSTCASPSGVFYNQAKHVRQIDVSTISGNMGILAYQAPVLSVLQPGVVSGFQLHGNTKTIFWQMKLFFLRSYRSIRNSKS